MFSVHAQVKYKKSVWGVVKGFIEKNTWAGLEDFYTALLRALQSEYCIPPAKAKGRRPRRGTVIQRRLCRGFFFNFHFFKESYRNNDRPMNRIVKSNHKRHDPNRRHWLRSDSKCRVVAANRCSCLSHFCSSLWSCWTWYCFWSCGRWRESEWVATISSRTFPNCGEFSGPVALAPPAPLRFVSILKINSPLPENRHRTTTTGWHCWSIRRPFTQPKQRSGSTFYKRQSICCERWDGQLKSWSGKFKKRNLFLPQTEQTLNELLHLIDLQAVQQQQQTTENSASSSASSAFVQDLWRILRERGEPGMWFLF